MLSRAVFHLRKFPWQKPQVLCVEQRSMAFLELKTLMHFYYNIYKCLSFFKGQTHRMLRLAWKLQEIPVSQDRVPL